MHFLDIVSEELLIKNQQQTLDKTNKELSAFFQPNFVKVYSFQKTKQSKPLNSVFSKLFIGTGP